MKEQSVCTTCRYVGHPKTATRGSFVIEIALWLLFIFPGILYSIWRLSTRQSVCPKCNNASMIPVGTPRGQELLQNQ